MDLTAAASRVMSLHLGREVDLEPIGPPRRHAGRQTLIRHRVTEGPSGAPATVMVKVPAPGGVSLGFFNEWAALEFLSELGLDPPVAPAFFGADRAGGVLVMEDLGDGECLADVLLRHEAAPAEDALVGLARTLGRMHAATVGRTEEHRRRRAELGPPGGEAVIAAEDLAPRFLQAVAHYGMPLGAAEQELDDIVAGVAAPGPFLGFVHGDIGPGNEQIVDGRSVLVDFATAGGRHVLLDAVCGRMSFPSSWCARRLPGDVPAMMAAAYRAELVAGCPAAADDSMVSAEALRACAYWLVETVAVALTARPFRDRTWGISTVGQRLAYQAAVFTGMTDRAGRYRELASVVTGLVAALGLDGDDMPPYPAFGGPASAAPGS